MFYIVESAGRRGFAEQHYFKVRNLILKILKGYFKVLWLKN
jgi:hypothetical protein